MDDEYDEFGNYIGPELGSEAEDGAAHRARFDANEDDESWMDNLQAREDAVVEEDIEMDGICFDHCLYD